MVRKPHGVRGGLKVTLYSIDLATLQNLEQLFVNTGNNWMTLNLKSCQGYADFAILNFDQIQDRTEAASYRGLELFTSSDQLPDLDEDEFYSTELVGCQVIDEHQNALGKVVEVLTPAAHEVLVVRQGDSETLIPLVDEWVVSIDVKQGLIQVNSVEEVS